MGVEKLLVADIESVEDTDEFAGNPTAAQVMDTVGLEVQRYAGPRVERNVDRHVIGNKEQINAGPQGIAKCGVYATGFGDAGTAALYDVLLRMCGFARTDDPGVSNTYDQADSGHESGSLWTFDDDVGLKQLLTGVRGSVSFGLEAEGLPMWNFENLIGTYARPVAGARPGAIDWSAFEDRPVLPATLVNTPTLTLDGYAIATQVFNVDWALDVQRINVPNLRSTRLPDKKPTGNFTFFAPPIGTKDFWTKLESHVGVNKLALSLVHGTVAGDIVEIAAAEYQIDDINESEIKGERAYEMTGRFIDFPQAIIR